VARDRASRPEAKPLRLFIAVDVPGPVRAALDSTIDPFRSGVPEARWTRPEGWHVTMKFLGATWPRLVDEVHASVDAAATAAAPIESALTTVGAFPSPRRARVIWAGLADPEDRLAAIARHLDERLEPHFRVEKRPLTPHLTLARLRTPANLERTAPDLTVLSIASAPFEIGELVVYRSHLSPKGAMYEAVHRVPLGTDGESA
jgi:2'-5' RNA ligase